MSDNFATSLDRVSLRDAEGTNCFSQAGVLPGIVSYNPDKKVFGSTKNDEGASSGG